MNSELFLIGIHVGDPSTELMPGIRPPNNYTGTLLLSRLLKLALGSAGLIQGEECCGASGELNDCIVMVQVTDEDAAIELIKSELDKVRLLSSCQIGVRRDREWVCIYPSPNVRMAWLLDDERRGLDEWETPRLCRGGSRSLTAPGVT
jgi:hypothetical protein